MGGKWYGSKAHPSQWKWHNRPRIRIDVHWPWVHRHERRWSPRYRYRQVVHVDAGWHRGHRSSHLDVRTYYRHRVRKASGSRAELDIIIDRIEIFEDGYFLGAVDRIPSDLSRLRATIYRNGRAQFDRDLFVIGDPHVGFELISTRHYDGFVLNNYHRSHGYRAGVLDFRRERVKKVRRSRFFDPFDFTGFVPIHLLPRDESWFGDYGYDAPSRHWYGDDDLYYYGFEDLDDYARFGGDRTEYRVVTPDSQEDVRVSRSAIEPMRREDDETFRTESGAEIRIRREAFIERIE